MPEIGSAGKSDKPVLDEKMLEEWYWGNPDNEGGGLDKIGLQGRIEHLIDALRAVRQELVQTKEWGKELVKYNNQHFNAAKAGEERIAELEQQLAEAQKELDGERAEDLALAPIIRDATVRLLEQQSQRDRERIAAKDSSLKEMIKHWPMSPYDRNPHPILDRARAALAKEEKDAR